MMSASGMGGTLGMTPAATPAPAMSPTQPVLGTSPTAKRPRDRSAYEQMEGDAPSRVMSGEELTQGFYNLTRLQSRDEKFLQGVAQCVHDNAGLLDAVVNRINGIEASLKLTQGVIEGQNAKLEQLTDDVKVGLEKVHGEDITRDTNLRNELDAMAKKLSDGHDRLQSMIEAATTKTATTTDGPAEIGALGERLRVMGENLDKRLTALTDQTGHIGKTTDQQEGRLGVIEMNAAHSATVVKEIQGAVTALNVELQQQRMAAQQAEQRQAAGALSQPDTWFGVKRGGSVGTAAPAAGRATYHNMSPGSRDEQHRDSGMGSHGEMAAL